VAGHWLEHDLNTIRHRATVAWSLDQRPANRNSPLPKGARNGPQSGVKLERTRFRHQTWSADGLRNHVSPNAHVWFKTCLTLPVVEPSGWWRSSGC